MRPGDTKHVRRLAEELFIKTTPDAAQRGKGYYLTPTLRARRCIEAAKAFADEWEAELAGTTKREEWREAALEWCYANGVTVEDIL